MIIQMICKALFDRGKGRLRQCALPARRVGMPAERFSLPALRASALDRFVAPLLAKTENR